MESKALLEKDLQAGQTTSDPERTGHAEWQTLQITANKVTPVQCHNTSFDILQVIQYFLCVCIHEQYKYHRYMWKAKGILTILAQNS